jgi:uncharacterized protein YutE (UPF0331/DUF86 family)
MIREGKQLPAEVIKKVPDIVEAVSYRDLDKEAVYRILQNCVDDFELFQKKAVAFLKA